MDKEEQLLEACRNGNLHEVKKWIKNGADIHTGYDYPIQLAANYGYLEVVKFLISNGSNINASNGLALRWAINRARNYNHHEIVKVLLENGANLKTMNYTAKQLFDLIEELFGDD